MQCAIERAVFNLEEHHLYNYTGSCVTSCAVLYKRWLLVSYQSNRVVLLISAS